MYNIHYWKTNSLTLIFKIILGVDKITEFSMHSYIFTWEALNLKQKMTLNHYFNQFSYLLLT
jgi:hypothetical protein